MPCRQRKNCLPACPAQKGWKSSFLPVISGMPAPPGVRPGAFHLAAAKACPCPPQFFPGVMGCPAQVVGWQSFPG